MSTRMSAFFDAWDNLEAAHPFGVMYFRDLFTEFGVPETLAGDVDEFLFLDLMSRRMASIRRIKIQARLTDEVFWAYLDLRTSTLSFQSHPAAPFTYSTTIALEPVCLVGALLAYHHHSHRTAPPIPLRHRQFDAYRRRAQ